MKRNGSSWRLLTPPPTGKHSAVAAILIHGDIQTAFHALDIRRVEPGQSRLRNLANIDEGLVARTSERDAILFPHASPIILSKLFKAFERAGIGADHTTNFAIETEDDLEQRILAALARTASPLAIDLLLDQPRRWRDRPNPDLRELEARSRILNRLIDPPTIVALGAPNIGKSTLLNTLAGRAVSIVADLPGTTRDHVGVALDLAGLAVRWIDTPGLEAHPAGASTAEAQQLALEQAAAADLILLCRDPTTQWPDHRSAESRKPSAASLRVLLRADLAPSQASSRHSPASLPDAVAIPPGRDPTGIPELVRRIRDTLLPPALLADPGPWDVQASRKP